MRNHVSQIRYDDKTVAAIVSEAIRWIGTPYQYAGNSTDGTDCSGLVMQVYDRAAGIKLPRNSAAQQQWCQPAIRDSIRPGDLLFFATGSDSARVSHVGIYIGKGEMIHASSSLGVIVSQIELPYYTQRYHSAGRALIAANDPEAVIPTVYVPNVANAAEVVEEQRIGQEPVAEQPDDVEDDPIVIDDFFN